MAGAFDLTGEVALVTGASRGIGSAIATTLAAAGARVVGTATTAGGAEQISARLAGVGQGGRGIVLDVSKPAEVLAVQKAIEEAEGTVTILVNNAGIPATTC